MQQYKAAPGFGMDDIEDLPVGWEKESSNADLPDKAGSQPISVHENN